MPVSTIIETITSHFITNWNNRTYVVISNRDYKPSTPINWVVFHVDDYKTSQVSIGSNPCYRTLGHVSVIINVPETSGIRVLNLLSDEAINIFINRQLGSIAFRDIDKSRGFIYEGFYRKEIAFYFYADEAVSSITA
jgi:hypothetical protein